MTHVFQDRHTFLDSKFKLVDAMNENLEKPKSKYYDYFFAEYNYNELNIHTIKNKNYQWYTRFAQLMPYKNDIAIHSIGEGNTPLIKSKKYRNCFFKDESRNPSGCFKDRENAVLFPYLKEQGVVKTAIASSGNAALSASLYGNLYGIEVICFVSQSTSHGKKSLIEVYGGKIIEIEGNYETSYKTLVDSDEYKNHVNITSGIHTLKDQGDKIIAYEIWDTLGVPDYVLVPAANGCLLAGIYKGFFELKILGLIERLPKIIGIQIEYGAPLAEALKQGKKDFVVLEGRLDSLAEGLVARESFCSPKALQALRDTQGVIYCVREESLLQGMRYALREEGLTPEWTSASVFAAGEDMYAKKIIDEFSTVVVINTSGGLKEISDIAEQLKK